MLSMMELPDIQYFYKKCASFLHLIRYWDWQDKIQSHAFAAVILLLFADSFNTQWKNLIFFILFLYIPFMFGHLINIYADRKTDLAVGKDFYLFFSDTFVVISFLFAGILTLTTLLYFCDIRVFFLIVLGLFGAVAYSCSPLRFKERGALGLITSSGTQQLPFLLFLILLPAHYYFVLYLFGWLLLVSLISETGHQLGDYDVDRKTQSKTFIVSIGERRGLIFIYLLSIVLIVYCIIPFFIFRGKGILLGLLLILLAHSPLYYAHLNIWIAHKRDSAKNSNNTYYFGLFLAPLILIYIIYKKIRDNI